ncbi:MAG: prepilin-type N-terminal cleavage/methylation domain-containing protein [Desulfobulbaceae bacterium]|nr:prepilin-type N-terminal cleavage/methylation domain-containing protein [Desulfobulbaceae bacterium]
MPTTNEKGFTLVEVIVVAAIIAILAGILVPMIFSQIDEAKISRAKGDIKSISAAIYAFRKDVGAWPKSTVDVACNSTMLISDGPGLPADMGIALQALLYNINGVKAFSTQLANDPGNNCYSNWKGPYLGSVDLDPWGHPYILNTVSIETNGEPALILSAGADGVFNTASNAATVDPNDIGLRLK